tara:strand:+ start:47 stop:871 length:825 start_codon:yes stop_codon:yes gene_type:complete
MIEKKHNYFYKITNLVNSKYYYGIKSTNNIEDRYFGSGTALKNAIKKYGVDNFTKEIIADYSTRKEASDHEARVVTLELIQLKECYNCKTGGDNGFIMSEESKKKMSISRAGKYNGSSHPMFGKKMSEESKKKMRESQKVRYTISDSHRKGVKLTEEHKKKLSENKKKYIEEHPEIRIKMSEYSKTKIWTDESKLKVSNKLSGRVLGDSVIENMKTAQRKRSAESRFKHKCVIFGVFYNSITDASNILKIENLEIIRYRCRSKSVKWAEWRYDL